MCVLTVYRTFLPDARPLKHDFEKNVNANFNQKLHLLNLIDCHLGHSPLISYAMNHAQALDHFKNSGALLEGHFILRSGLRSRQFFQCALALQDMPSVELLGAALASKSSIPFSTVVAPAMGGLVIGQEVARQLKKRYIFAEKKDDRLVLRRGTRNDPSNV